MTQTVAILGASGFVGSTLVEHLTPRDDLAVTAFSHSTGGAACLAHRGMVFEKIDIMDRSAVDKRLRDFDFVVNCSRGGPQVMREGLDNVIGACEKGKTAKLVHLSSVAIYGDPPHPDSTTEHAPTEPAPASYGALKLAQDQKVQAAAEKGLGALILCPPNITGPFSEYVMNVIASIERGRFRLVDDGQHAISVVDVRNLCAAIERAIDCDIDDGRRLFVCDPDDVTWAGFCRALAPVVRRKQAIASMPEQQLRALMQRQQAPRSQVSKSALKHLVSDEIREILRLNKRWAAVEGVAKSAVRMLGDRTEDYMREVTGGIVKVETTPAEPALDTTLVAQQLRKVRHDPSRLQTELAFTPPLSFEQSMDSFRRWHNLYLASDSDDWALLGEAVAL